MKFGRKKAEKDYQTWPIWDNYRYAFAWIKRSEGMKPFGFCIADVVLQVAVPFMQMALPGAVCAFLTSGRRAEQILFLICSYVLLVQALSLLAGYVGERRQLELFLFRMDCDKEFYPKCLDVDAQFLESTLGQKKQKNACMNIYSGNDIGIEAFVNALLKAATNLGGLTVYAVLIGQNSLPLLAFLVLLTALVSACNYRYGKKGTGFFENGWKIMQNCLYLLKESIAAENGKDIRLYRMKKMFGDAFRRMTDQAVETKHREQTCYLRAEMVEKGAALLRDGVVYGYLIFQMMRGSLALPGFLLYAGIVAGFGSWMSGLVTSVQNMVKNNYLMDRYRDFMVSGVVETEGKQAVLRPGKAHEIRLEHVCFRYEGQEEDVLHDISLTIKTGEKLALVGANGAGKTTLVKLISGLYQPTEGKIYLDGQDVSQILKEDYFKELSVVFQDVFAFSFPLEDNVSCRDTEHMDTEKMVESLKKADLWEKVSTLEKGSKTVMNKDLDENGVSLSGGELQKLMLARALYKDAAVVILDEPTAALDPLAESAMYERYYEMTRQKTAVFISHRLSSTRFCDRIILLENGQITETGNHEELMQKKGAYARMFELQAKYYKEKEKGEECYA